MSEVIVIGGGAAGMLAAVSAARCGHSVNLYEKNEKLGKKIFITGKGRCNLTNACDMETLFESVCTNRKFLYSAFYGFTNQDTIDFFEQCGMKTKVERGSRVFPVSDHSSDVIAALQRELKNQGVRIHLNTEVKELWMEKEKNLLQEKAEDGGERLRGIILADGTKKAAEAVVVATGGLSYAATGSTGDGYRFAKSAGHKVEECSPSLVPLNILEEDASQMQGLSLKNVKVSIQDGKKLLYEDFGEMMFTHFGVTGPLILSASSQIQKKLKSHPLHMSIDLKPALSQEQLDARILREFEKNKNRQFKNVLPSLFPAKLIPVMVKRCGISAEQPIHDISREQRQQLINAAKGFGLTITGLRGYNEAVITRGGV
ncbi:MAG: aminoacetone oxidase family FAD-binding enzyme, partial [Lachnospiraceae bacterium]|nr:aminoacetone oxidase family FAD-binding enzyme [Lachnospiraceae bacterium]